MKNCIYSDYLNYCLLHNSGKKLGCSPDGFCYVVNSTNPESLCESYFNVENMEKETKSGIDSNRKFD